MSREIDVDTTDIEALRGLDDGDLRYLLDRNMVPAALAEELRQDGFQDDLANESISLADRGNTGTVRSISTEELEAELERRREDAETNPNEAGPENESFANDDDDDDEEEDGELDPESMTNEDLRTELARRELSTSGRKDELVARLTEALEAEEEEEE